MNSFTYHNPVKVVFGLGTLKQSGEEAAKLGKRAFVVSYGDASVSRRRSSWRSCPTRRSRWSRAAWTRRRRSARTS